MRFWTSAPAFLVLLVVVLIAAGCRKSTQPDPPTGTLTLEFEHCVSGTPLTPNSIQYTNTAGNRYSIVTLRYYVSNFVLHHTNGSKHTIDTRHYRDFEDPTTRQLDLENVPNGSYDRLTFTFGLDAVTNVSGGLPTTRENLNMAWPEPWGGGYHYMQLEGHFVAAAGDTTGYATHTGRRQLDEDTQPYHHFFEVTVPLRGVGLDPIQVDQDAWRIEVVMNLDQWYTDPNTYDLDDFPGNIMINLEAQRILMENGSTVFEAREAFLVEP